MRFINILLGKLIRSFSKFHRWVLDGLIYLIETGVLLSKSFIKGCFFILGIGGCLFFFLLLGPLGDFLFSHPVIVFILLIIVIFPILGAISVSYLNEYKIISVAYLTNLSLTLLDPEHYTYKNYKYYKNKRKQEKADQARREQERRDAQQRMWEERFRQWQGFSGGYGRGYTSGYGGSSSGSTYSNPYEDFKNKYENSCKVLGIATTIDPSRIKLAYRKMAKQFHPDVNKAPDATRRFQEISEAYEFLNEDNIARYKRMGSQ
ncbi:MAG: DnaJ domain-containing protein [Clostridiaceae bacterium]|nr:DnaJ domain-containing protein [Clostridiaceae bacterium]